MEAEKGPVQSALTNDLSSFLRAARYVAHELYIGCSSTLWESDTCFYPWQRRTMHSAGLLNFLPFIVNGRPSLITLMNKLVAS